jgi:hypothetical protein
MFHPCLVIEHRGEANRPVVATWPIRAAVVAGTLLALSSLVSFANPWLVASGVIG